MPGDPHNGLRRRRASAQLAKLPGARTPSAPLLNQEEGCFHCSCAGIKLLGLPTDQIDSYPSSRRATHFFGSGESLTTPRSRAVRTSKSKLVQPALAMAPELGTTTKTRRHRPDTIDGPEASCPDAHRHCDSIPRPGQLLAMVPTPGNFTPGPQG